MKLTAINSLIFFTLIKGLSTDFRALKNEIEKRCTQHPVACDLPLDYIARCSLAEPAPLHCIWFRRIQIADCRVAYADDERD
jgi:hypothetical protein